MKDVIIRNMERLIACSSDSDREPIEPMSAWKWRKLYKIANKYDIVPWIAEGIRAYEGVGKMTGYHFGYELLMLNGMLTFCGLWLISHPSISRSIP